MLAKQLLLTAVDLDVPMATYIIVSFSLQRDQGWSLSKPDLGPVTQHLSTLASKGADIRAMVLWGRVLLSRGDESQAMRIFERIVAGAGLQREQAVKSSGSKREEEEEKEHRKIDERLVPGASIADAYLEMGHIQWRLGDTQQNVESIFRIAAERYNHPDAWLQLAKLQSPLPAPASSVTSNIKGRATGTRMQSQTQSQVIDETDRPPYDREDGEKLREKYLLASARAGNIEAARLLAELYQNRCNDSTSITSRDDSKSNRLVRSTPKATHRTNQMWAKEWSDLVRSISRTATPNARPTGTRMNP